MQAAASSSHSFRVRYQETDQMGVVYYANYLNWFEIARTEWIRERGLTYKKIEEYGLFLPVTDASLKYIQPARYDDCITVITTMESLSPIRVKYSYEVRRHEQGDHAAETAGELLATGQTTLVWLNKHWSPIRVDKTAPELYGLFQKYCKP